MQSHHLSASIHSDFFFFDGDFVLPRHISLNMLNKS